MGKNLTVLDLEVAKLKAKGRFRIRDSKSERLYTFRYDKKDEDLYLILSGKEYKVSNPGTSLYAFANGTKSFDVYIQNPASGVRPYYTIEEIVIA